MSDNYTANPGSGGDTFAADDISGVKTPRVKLQWGADGTVVDASLAAPLPVELVPISDAGGCSVAGGVSAASNNATNVKAAAGKVYAFWAFATNATPATRYLKLYNKATTPAPASDTPFLRIPIPSATAGAGIALAFPNGIAFSTGIGYALVTGASDSDNTSVAASEIVFQLIYI